MGKITAISSPCKTGKTTALVNWVSAHRTQYPQGKVYLLGYRNALLMQSCKRMYIEHIHDLQTGRGRKVDASYINSQREIGLCLDSLLKIDFEKITPNSLILLDEGEAVVKHLLEGGTMGKDRPKIAEYFRRFANRVLELDGAVAILEDGLTDLSLNFLSEMSTINNGVHLVSNTYRASHWKTTIIDGSSSAFVEGLSLAAVGGKRLFVPTTSQKFGEKLELILKRYYPYLKIVRLDRETMEAEETNIAMHALMSDPDEWLERERPDVFILSPTGESGVSVWANLFDEVWAYIANLDTRAHIQMLERFRLEVPRFIWVANRMETGETDAKKLLGAWNKSLAITGKQCGFDSEEFAAKVEESRFWNHHAAQFKARDAASSTAMKLNLVAALKDRGHDVIEVKGERSQARADDLKWASGIIDERRSSEVANADDKGMTEQEAIQVEKMPDAGKELRLAARKVRMQARVPGVQLTTEFVLKAFIQDRGHLATSTENWWYCTHPEIASALDWSAMNFALKGSELKSPDPILFADRFTHRRQKADLVFQLEGLKELIETDREYRGTDELVIGIARAAYANRFDIARLFGLHIGNPDGENKSHTPIATVNKLCKRFGLKPEVARKEGKRGEQKSVWHFASDTKPERTAILEAMERRYSTLLEEVEMQKAKELAAQKAALDAMILKQEETEVAQENAPRSQAIATETPSVWTGRILRIAETVSRVFEVAWYFRGRTVEVLSEPKQAMNSWVVECRIEGADLRCPSSCVPCESLLVAS